MRLIIDAYPGIDDSLAILLALISSEVLVEGLTVVSGKTTAAQGVLARTGAIDTPVSVGVPIPLVHSLLVATR